MNLKPPFVVLQENSTEIASIKSAFDFLEVNHPIYFFTCTIEFDKYLEEAYPSEPKKDTKPLPAFFLFDYFVGGEPVLETLKRLKSSPVFCTVPVVIFSGNCEPDHVSSCYAHGCAGFFLKPDSFDGYHKVLEVIYQFWQATGTNARTGNRRSRYAKIS